MRYNRLAAQPFGMRAIRLPLGHPAKIPNLPRKRRAFVAIIAHAGKLTILKDIVNIIPKH